MMWTLPGTTLQAPRSEADRAKELFENLFLAGGLTLSQVASITGLEPYAIQNWVKRGFLPPPKNKRYDLEQLCRIVTINMLKGALTLERICSLMQYINGDLTDESVINKVSEPNPAYILVEKGAVLNWWDIVSVPGHADLNTKLRFLNAALGLEGTARLMAPLLG